MNAGRRGDETGAGLATAVFRVEICPRYRVGAAGVGGELSVGVLVVPSEDGVCSTIVRFSRRALVALALLNHPSGTGTSRYRKSSMVSSSFSVSWLK
jgi:hypothetical protein